MYIIVCYVFSLCIETVKPCEWHGAARNDTQVIEGMVANHVVEDMDIINRLPPMENASTSNTSSRQQHGFGELTKSLEFVRLATLRAFCYSIFYSCSCFLELIGLIRP